MLASNFNKVGEVSINVSEQKTSSSQNEIKIIKLEIYNDEIRSEGKVYNLDDIPAVINSSIDIKEDHRIVLISDESIHYERLMNVVEYLELNNINNVNIGITKYEDK